jgi:hypothetical protein
MDKCMQYIWEDVINAQNTIFEESERKNFVFMYDIKNNLK